MDITSFVVQGRDKALLYGDYATYHSQLAKRLLNSRKKLGLATKNRGKFKPRDDITAQEIAETREHVYLSLLTSERAYAQAMSIKASHATDQKGIVGKARQHIISRLTKAANNADQLVEALEDDTSGASTTDILEAKAYATMIYGASLFEKQAWEPCLKQYATARVIYSALATAAKGDIFKDLLSETVDPSIRYAAYQLKTPRTIPIPIIARKAFPQADTDLVEEITKINPDILNQTDTESTQEVSEAATAPRTLIWRSREVKIEDAQIAISWGSVEAAKTRLAEKLENLDDSEPHEVAAAYDEILTATQDAVDATKTAIDELRGEGVGQGDARMQSLQITRTAVNYEMISWRIGRNRVLTGPHDGATEQYDFSRRRKKHKDGEELAKREREEPTSRKLAKLKEKAALYDGTLQNLESIKELPGVAADEGLASTLAAYVKYFEALASLSIARSHAIIDNATNALALISHALTLTNAAKTLIPKSSHPSTPLSVYVSPEALSHLTTLLTGEFQRHHAIVHIDNLRKEDKAYVAQSAKAIPLAERLFEYPIGAVDLENIVEFPPKMTLIPVKPIFLDVAWNYIEYPGKTSQAAQLDKKAPKEPEQEEPKPVAKKGWFGFGRA